MADKYVNATGLRAVIDWILSAFTKKKDFDALEIGGRNLLLYSEDLTKWKKEYGVSVVKDSDGWFKVVDSPHTSSTWGIYFEVLEYEQNTDYTISVDAKYGNTKIGMGYGFDSWGTDYKEIDSGSKRLKTTFNTGSNTKMIRIYLFIHKTSANQYGYFKLPKLEKGNKATDWTPAPEDVKTAISDVTNDCIKGLSVSDKTITYTKGDGSKGTITTQDTNTWRGIQNNLTSDSTTDSLAAAQGKALKALVDGKAASSHTHAKSDITDMPTSLPANGGNADTATKLATARTIALTGSVTGSGSFDGSGNLSIATTTNHTHNYLPLSGGTMTSNICFNNTNLYIGSSGKDGANGVGGELNNLVLGSWYGISFTGTYGTYAGKTAVGIDCRNSIVYANTFNGTATNSNCLYMPRVGGDANWLPDTAERVQMREFSSDSSNMPKSDWFHILASRSADTSFGSQLAIGMTTDDLYYRACYAGNFSTWHRAGTDVVIGTSSGTVAYKSGYTKAVVEFWKTTVGSASRTVYDAALITGLSSSMTAVTPSAISSGQDFAFALGNDASGGIIISGNFSKYKITYFN